jgi:hypothetical protein
VVAPDFETRSVSLLLSRSLSSLCLSLAFLIATVGSAGAEQLNDDQMWQVISEAFPGDQVGKAVAVAWCESRFDAAARAPYGYQGLFQIDPWLHGWRAEELFGPGASLNDPHVNAAVAAQIWAESGWGPWPVCGRRF